jgi:glutamyl-tRNA synthetase
VPDTPTVALTDLAYPVPSLRFAPSPTGPLHIGGVRTALYNFLLARQIGGRLLLRIEDTDQGRYVSGAEQYIIDSLAWLGITFDEGPHQPHGVVGPHAPYRQSERKAMYRQYADELIASGHAYYAFDTEADLDTMRKRSEAAGIKSPQYNAVTREHMQNSLALPADEVQRRIAEGVPYVIRFKVPRKEEVRFQDEIRGWIVYASAELDDKVLLKSDGMPTYHLANVVDDRLMQITHVIRGEEWLPSTPLHVLLYRAFGWPQPKFAHLPLLLRPDGHGKLSKRDGDQLGFPVFPMNWLNADTGDTASGFRERGFLPAALLNFLAFLGWNPGTEQEIFSLDELIAAFSLDRVGKAGTRFDFQKALWFNQHYLRATPVAELAQSLRTALVTDGLAGDWTDAYLERVVTLLLDRVHFTTEFLPQGRYFFEHPTAFDDAMKAKQWRAPAPDAICQYAERIAALPGDAASTDFESTFKALAEALGIKPGSVMGALRLATTGVPAGPAVFDIHAALGPATAAARLTHSLAALGPAA